MVVKQLNHKEKIMLYRKKFLKDNQKVKQKEIAEAMGVKSQAVSNLEKELSSVSLERFKDYLKACGKTMIVIDNDNCPTAKYEVSRGSMDKQFITLPDLEGAIHTFDIPFGTEGMFNREYYRTIQNHYMIFEYSEVIKPKK